MRSNNNFLSDPVSSLIMVMFLILSFVISYDISNQVRALNKDIDVLKLHNTNYGSVIDHMEKQIVSYILENNELKDRISSYNKDVQELVTYSVEEDPRPDPDTIILAQLIESESGNQSFDGKLAVGTVVMNRVDSDEFPDTIREVVFQKGQFSVVPNGAINNEPSEVSLNAAREILEGKRTLGPNVLYFYNPKITSKTNWIRSRTVSKTIDDHRFAI